MWFGFPLPNARRRCFALLWLLGSLASPGPAFAALPCAAPPCPQEEAPDEPSAKPHFERFFPDDVEAGQALDLFWTQRNQRTPNAKRDLPIVRKGLRRTTVPRTSILRWVGNKFIWEKNPQNAEAIEIMFHAADYAPEADRYGTRHFAVYFGLSVIRPKPPRILKTLVDLSMASDNPDTIGRVAWGCQSQQSELLKELAPYLQSTDPAVQRKAKALDQIFRGELDAFAWAKEHAKQVALAKVRQELPAYRAALLAGPSEERLKVLDGLLADEAVPALQLDFLPALVAAAQDERAPVRERVAKVAGGRWCDRQVETPSEVLPLLLALSHDPEASVRLAAVHFGLANLRDPGPAVLERMLAMLREAPSMDLASSIHRALQSNRKATFEILEQQIRSGSAAQALWAYQFYERIANRPPPVAPPGVATVERLAGRWDLELTLGPGNSSVRMPLVFRYNPKAKESLRLSGRIGEAAMEHLGYGHQDGELVVAFDCLLAGQVHHVTARLQGEALQGTARARGQSALLFWTATRREPR